MDTKKKEVLGNLKNAGQDVSSERRTLRRSRRTISPTRNWARRFPTACTTFHGNEAGVSVGISHDTAEFAVEAIRRWWKKLGRKRYGQAKRLLVTADSGGSNSSRSRLWKVELQKFADETGLIIEVSHLSAGHEQMEQDRAPGVLPHHAKLAGKPLETLEVVVESIGATTTENGLGSSRVDRREPYEKGRKVSDEELAECNIKCNTYHGEWNYEIHPRSNQDSVIYFGVVPKPCPYLRAFGICGLTERIRAERVEL